MHVRKLLKLATIPLALLAACDGGGTSSPPPPAAVGAISGQVSIEGQGIDGVTVALSTGASTSTAGGGRFSFANVAAGSYTVTISNFPADASFSSTAQPTAITSNGQTAVVNFSGTYIRTASIIGSVTVEGDGLGGVTVRISGTVDQATQTDATGQYAFGRLRAGQYQVELSGFGADMDFSTVSRSVTLDVDETKTATFSGTYVRTASVVGRVSVEGNGLAGVTVSLSGLESRTATTDSAGQYAFAGLRAGSYTVGISGYDAEEHAFGQTTWSGSVALGQTVNVPFDGSRLRTAEISGRVAVEGNGLAGVTVNLSGIESRTATTNAAGQYAFAELRAGSYTVGISGFDADDHGFSETSRSVTVALGQSVNVPFNGIRLRTAVISGRVAIEGNGLAGVTVSLAGAESREATTDAAGQYTFAELRAGSYMVAISGYDAEEHEFEQTSWSGSVALGQSVNVPFDGSRLRTAFSIEIHHVEGSLVTDAHRAAFEQAAEIWESAIRNDLPDANMSQEELNQCGRRHFAVGADTDLVVDDLLIYAKVYEIDGPGGTLALAGPCFIRGGSGLPIAGVMGFDVADANVLENAGAFEGTVLHEMAHVLGFGAIWAYKGLLADSATTGNEDTHFTGEAALAAFDAVGGASYDDGAKVPVENLGDQGTRNGHWRESVFVHELMTGWISGPDDPLSIVTLASLEDVGYEVKYNVAEEYTLPTAAPPRLRAGHRIDLGDDILRTPIGVVDRNGRVVRYLVPGQRR